MENNLQKMFAYQEIMNKTGEYLSFRCFEMRIWF